MWKETKTRSETRISVARVLFLFVVVLATAFGAYMVGRSQSPATLNEEDRESVALYAEALDAVRKNYVDQKSIDSKKETYGAIEGMLDTLGDDAFPDPRGAQTARPEHLRNVRGDRGPTRGGEW